VFDKKCLLQGTNQLNQRISKIPVGTTIFWMDQIVGTKPAGKAAELAYPPADIVQKVKRLAKARHIEVEARAN